MNQKTRDNCRKRINSELVKHDHKENKQQGTVNESADEK